MWSAARLLSGLEGQLPTGGSRFTVEFAKPVVLPTKVAFFAAKAGDAWNLQLRKASKLETLHAIGRVEPA
jgi:hypothetical protein